MSGTQPTTTVTPGQTIVSLLGAPITSILAFAAFGICIALAYRLPDQTIFNTLCGSAAGLATMGAQHWFGSSNSSQKKDSTIAAQSAMLAASEPPKSASGSTTVTQTPATTTVETPAGTTTTTTPVPPIVVQGGTIETPGTSIP